MSDQHHKDAHAIIIAIQVVMLAILLLSLLGISKIYESQHRIELTLEHISNQLQRQAHP